MTCAPRGVGKPQRRRRRGPKEQTVVASDSPVAFSIFLPANGFRNCSDSLCREIIKGVDEAEAHPTPASPASVRASCAGWRKSLALSKFNEGDRLLHPRGRMLPAVERGGSDGVTDGQVKRRDAVRSSCDSTARARRGVMGSQCSLVSTRLNAI